MVVGLFIHISLELAAKRQKKDGRPTSPSANMTCVTITSLWSSRRGNEKIFAAHDLMRETRHGHMCCSGMLTYSYPAASLPWKWKFIYLNLCHTSALTPQQDNHPLSSIKIELDRVIVSCLKGYRPSFDIHFHFLERFIISEKHFTFMQQAIMEFKLPLADDHFPVISVLIRQFNAAIFRGYFKPLGA